MPVLSNDSGASEQGRRPLGGLRETDGEHVCVPAVSKAVWVVSI